MKQATPFPPPISSQDKELFVKKNMLWEERERIQKACFIACLAHNATEQRHLKGR